MRDCRCLSDCRIKETVQCERLRLDTLSVSISRPVIR
jgi:hypothetical protein